LTPALYLPGACYHRALHSFPTRRSSDLWALGSGSPFIVQATSVSGCIAFSSGMLSVYWSYASNLMSTTPSLSPARRRNSRKGMRSEEHTSELQSRENLVCRLLLEKKKKR